jgi:hypothetical protein
MSEALNFVSRRGAELAERAEGHLPSRSRISAASANSAPLRETNSALRAGVTL